jgi:hypothetical protein
MSRVPKPKPVSEPKIKLLLDSGAFSAWKQNKPIPVDEYAKYCHAHKHHVDAYVNMDVIPGENGRMDRSQSTIEKSAAKSHENLLQMKALGLSPVPVFHQGEQFEWLERMLDEGEPYIGISPYLRSHQNEIISWLDRCFSIVTDSNGRPLVKTHGFGVTACNLVVRYPWFSVDSTSWSVGGAYGICYIPQRDRHGKADFTRPQLSVHLTARTAEELSSVKRGFDNLGEAEQEVVRQAVAEAGVKLSEVRNNFLGRWRLNMRYFSGMAAACTGPLFTNKAPSLLNTYKSNRKGYDPKPVRLYFASVPFTMVHNKFLNSVNEHNRLLSYAHLRELPPEFLDFYLEHGLPHFPRTRHKKANLKLWTNEAYRVARKMALLERIERPDDDEAA